MSFDIGDAARLARMAKRLDGGGASRGRGGGGGRRGIGCFGCLAPIVGFLVIGAVGAYIAMGSLKSEVHDSAMALLRECPAAQETLGDDIKLRVGMFSGSSNSNGAYGRATWQYPVQGSSAQGMYNWAAQREGGPWVFDTAFLSVGDITVDLRTCQFLSTPPPVMPASPNIQQPALPQPMPQPGMPQPGVQQPMGNQPASGGKP